MRVVALDEYSRSTPPSSVSEPRPSIAEDFSAVSCRVPSHERFACVGSAYTSTTLPNALHLVDSASKAALAHRRTSASSFEHRRQQRLAPLASSGAARRLTGPKLLCCSSAAVAADTARHV